MKLKLPSTNLSYAILNVKYTLNGEECECKMHKLNNNKMDEVEIDCPTGAIVTNVTMSEVTNAHVVVSSQVLYDKPEPKPEPKPEANPEAESNSNLKVETQAKVEITKKEKHATTHLDREAKGKSQSGSQKESKQKS